MVTLDQKLEHNKIFNLLLRRVVGRDMSLYQAHKTLARHMGDKYVLIKSNDKRVFYRN